MATMADDGVARIDRSIGKAPPAIRACVPKLCYRHGLSVGKARSSINPEAWACPKPGSARAYKHEHPAALLLLPASHRESLQDRHLEAQSTISHRASELPPFVFAREIACTRDAYVTEFTLTISVVDKSSRHGWQLTAMNSPRGKP